MDGWKRKDNREKKRGENEKIDGSRMRDDGAVDRILEGALEVL